MFRLCKVVDGCDHANWRYSDTGFIGCHTRSFGVRDIRWDYAQYNLVFRFKILSRIDCEISILPATAPG